MEKNVLIVEDNPLLADSMAGLVSDSIPCRAVAVPSVAEAKGWLDKNIMFGLLDVEVADGLTFPLAAQLKERGIPFAFISGTDPQTVPADFASAPFLRKPVGPSELIAAARRYLVRSEEA